MIEVGLLGLGSLRDDTPSVPLGSLSYLGRLTRTGYKHRLRGKDQDQPSVTVALSPALAAPNAH
jgi:hypothetical protein